MTSNTALHTAVSAPATPPVPPPDISTRKASETVMQALAARIPEQIGRAHV